MRLRVNHRAAPIAPLDGVPPLPQRKQDGKSKNRKPRKAPPPPSGSPMARTEPRFRRR